MLWGFFIRRQRIPLTPVDEVEGYGLLLLDKRLLLPMRLKQRQVQYLIKDIRERQY